MYNRFMRNLDGFFRYEYIVIEKKKIIKVPRLSGMYEILKRDYYFKKEFGYIYSVLILSPDKWEKLKKKNEVRIFITKERK